MYDTGCRDVVHVPDNPLSHMLQVFDQRFADVRLILATREEEAFGIAAGLYLGGRLPAVMLQSSGLGNSLNAITSLLVPYQIPALIVISWRGDEGEWNPAQVPMGRAIHTILTTIGVAHATIESSDRARELVQTMGATVRRTHLPGACLLPRRMTMDRT